MGGLRALVVAIALLLVAAAEASATTRFAVPGGTGTSMDCTFDTDQCSLKHVLEDVVGANDEVIVLPGTHDFGTNPVNVRSAGRPLNIHGQEGQPRPTIVADAAYVLGSCNPSPCVDDNTVFRHLRIENKTKGGGLYFNGGLAASPVTVDDVVVVLGTSGMVNGNGLLVGGKPGGAVAYAFIRNTTVFAPGDNQFAIGAAANLTLRGVTAIATGNNSHALSQGANCVPGDCGNDAQSNVFNSILQGGPGGADVRTTLSFNNHLANVALDYSNFDSVISCAGCTNSAPGSAHNQTAAPLLVDKAGGDFHESAGSPTIDAGIDDPLNGLTDLDGNPRKLGAAPDIGAFETAGPGNPTTNPNPTPGTVITPIQLTVGGVTLTLNLPTVLKVSGKYVVIPFVCPVGVTGNCTGAIKIVTASKVLVPKKVSAAARRKKKKLTLGNTSFSVPSGQTKNVRVKLSKAALKLLAAKGKVKAVVTLKATANGATKSAQKKVTVKGKKKR